MVNNLIVLAKKPPPPVGYRVKFRRTRSNGLEFVNKLSDASPLERLSEINLLCKKRAVE